MFQMCPPTLQADLDSTWSLHSPDLNPPDFCLWGYLKDRVYEHNPQTIPDLKAAITTAIGAMLREEEGTLLGKSKSACNARGRI